MDRQNLRFLEQNPYKVSWKADGTRWVYRSWVLLTVNGSLSTSVNTAVGLCVSHRTDGPLFPFNRLLLRVQITCIPSVNLLPWPVSEDWDNYKHDVWVWLGFIFRIFLYGKSSTLNGHCVRIWSVVPKWLMKTQEEHHHRVALRLPPSPLVADLSSARVAWLDAKWGETGFSIPAVCYEAPCFSRRGECAAEYLMTALNFTIFTYRRFNFP